ncbi:GspH/FimT family pseudopilin [Microbulbifer sp. SSSA002]|uniref:GspH/FimT family pseudopilin n=1 Tax=unclassified Microbulbifer TaxID=2619833 RepID=UPI0040399F0B
MRYRNTGQGGPAQRQAGFTLIEMMITLVVLAVLVSIAVPSFTDMMNNSRSVALAEDFAGALNYTRSEAVRRGDRVSICASSDGASCGATNNWSQGWIVFADGATTDSAGTPVVSEVIRVWDISDSNAAITVTQTSGTTNFIRYTDVGTLGRFTQTSVVAKNSNCTASNARTITVGAAGLITIAKTDC